MAGTKINPADIIIMEAGDDWISKSIAWITNSTVSHAALYRPDTELVEMCLSGIRASKFRFAENGRKVYIIRLTPEQAPSPVLAAAQKYLNAEVRYDFPALVILAGLLIYRNIRPTPKLMKITDLVIRAGCQMLDKLLQKATHTEGAMVCSQLVYQCYMDCGEDYRIHLSDDCGPVTVLQNSVCLYSLLESRNMPVATYAPDNVEYDVDALSADLYEVLTESVSADTLTTSEVSETLLGVAKHFLELVEEILEKSGDVIPVQSLFVTPADLLKRAVNLTCIDEAFIEYE